MTDTSISASQQAAQLQTHEFQADVSRLLGLMVHSIYSNREIFLRELISNAADACEKLRFESVSSASDVSVDAKFLISVIIRAEAGTLEISDNGIGMSHDEMVAALGTIANSGTRAFLEKQQIKPRPEEESELDGGANSTSNLIGQFGIGFYSAFMVADRVTVHSRKIDESQAWSWTSDGRGTFSTAPISNDLAPTHGTRVILELKPDARDLLEPLRIESIIREHSGAISTPIQIEEGGKRRQIWDGGTLWNKPRDAIEAKDYAEFYQSLTGQFDEPALTLHWRIEGRLEYTVLAFVPGSRPFDLFDPQRKARSKLYVRHVLISQDVDLLPSWLRFFRLVVDSADLPLNVSRELIQQSPVLAAIKRGMRNRIVQELTKASEAKPEIFEKIWENFGSVLKEGLYEEPDLRESIFKFARFTTSTRAHKPVTMAEYVAALRPNQTAIFYLAGDDAARIAESPQLEGYRSRGIEVILLSDPVDPFWISATEGFDGKPFKSVTQGSADISLIPLVDGAKKSDEAASSVAAQTLFTFFAKTLESEVSDVRKSDRLTESVACLVAAAGGPDRRIERMLSEAGRISHASKPVLEINPAHPLIVSMAAAFAATTDISIFEDIAWLLVDEARILDGDAPVNAAEFASRLTRTLLKVTL